MSKATKKAKQQARVAPNRRRGARKGLKPFTPNPALTPSDDFLIDASIDMALLVLLKRAGITRMLKRAILKAPVTVVVDGGGDDGECFEGAD